MRGNRFEQGCGRPEGHFPVKKNIHLKNIAVFDLYQRQAGGARLYEFVLPKIFWLKSYTYIRITLPRKE
jgi:hypothetical protein